MKGLGIAAGAIGLSGVILAFKSCIEESMKFEKSLLELSTMMSDVSDEAIQRMSDSLKDLYRTMPITSMKEATDALYQIKSAGVEAKDQMDFLKSATILATAGLANLKDTTNALLAIIKGYSMDMSEAANVSDLLFKTVELGQTTLGELASNIGRVVPLASALGISLEELLATLSTLSGVTGDTNEVTTQMAAIMTAFIKPTEDMKNLIHALGYESSKAMLYELGLAGALSTLTDVVPNTTEEIGDLFGRQEAINAVLALSDPLLKKQIENYDEMRKAAKNGTLTLEKYREMTKGSWTEAQLATNQFKLMKEELGRELTPAFEALIRIGYALITAMEFSRKQFDYLILSLKILHIDLVKVKIAFKSLLGLDTSELEQKIKNLTKDTEDWLKQMQENDQAMYEHSKIFVQGYGDIEDAQKQAYDSFMRSNADVQDGVEDTTNLYEQLKYKILDIGDDTFRPHLDAIKEIQGEYQDLGLEIDEINGKIDDSGDEIKKMQHEISGIRLKARREGRDLTEEEKNKIDEIQLAIDEERYKAEELSIRKDELNEKREEAKDKIDNEVSSMQKAINEMDATMKKKVALMNVINDEIKAWNELWKARRGEGGTPIEVPTLKTPKSSSTTGKIQSYQSGTFYVPKNMLALLHKGEKVIPARANKEPTPTVIQNTFNFPNATIRSDQDITKIAEAVSRELRKSLVSVK